jgi:hypothetical protein
MQIEQRKVPAKEFQPTVRRQLLANELDVEITFDSAA